MFESKKFCPVCGELAAVLDGDPDKYGDKAVPYHTFIRIKYDCDECRNMMKGQSNRLADKRYRKRRKEQLDAMIDVVGAYREEARLSKQRVGLLECENRKLRQRLAKQGAGT